MPALVTIPTVGRFKPLIPGRIHMRCRRCKRTLSNMPRHPYDLEGSAVIVMNYCDRCDKGGEFEDSQYFDLNGKAIAPI